MASPVSSTRSAAQATYSAYKRQPIRWRLAGGSAALTLVILLGFAVIVGTLTTRAIYSDFNRQVASAADRLEAQLRYDFKQLDPNGNPQYTPNIDLDSYVSSTNAAVRVVYLNGQRFDGSRNAPSFGAPDASRKEVDGWRVETREAPLSRPGTAVYYTLAIQYARRMSDVRATANRVKVFLGLGVLGGAGLALLAGLATARRAMEPIAELTATAREVERTGDATVAIPRPEADDEVAELATTFEEMLQALEKERAETALTLERQREFVADASHELRTPLTSVLANLELLEETLTGEHKEAAASALRSSKRMRRLVADLLLLARQDAGRVPIQHRPVDLSEIVAAAAAELEPVAGDHEISITARPGAWIEGVQDELHRLVLNLMENALRHTDPGTAVEASVERQGDQIVLAVEDDGPGIAPELREKVFERFFRAHGDRSGSSGLGLAIVRAVAESHHGSVSLEPPLDGRGARFVVRFPASP
ncbi:HAMP domain-containing histidine kinase [Solirubrobacter sp. CPCC 204708]|uniref:histidine kinase n=1 Tax=Solirubrobacter deserti TaxID=2282478 RepID=A0ABT4RHJ6_9ACTN|nr:HAMP domain-containing sensor histidine kinase [Solirubrobacter deserti]MBE2315329.1 HAMP domain-containing histidine kinase [Solirubrobacter deserti]MDA0137826.1 HAMP domain-containing histidine kinase [Solirubrobacter deserti]